MSARLAGAACAVCLSGALGTAHAADEVREPVALSVVGCEAPSPLALMEVLKFEANLRAARVGEIERHVVELRCETARYVVTLAAPGEPPYSRRELDPQYIPAGSTSRAVALTIAEMLDERERWRGRAIVSAASALRQSARAADAASRAARVARAGSSRARGFALERAPRPRAHTVMLGVSGDGVMSAPAAHVGLALGYLWSPSSRWGVDLGARVSAGALDDRVASARLEARAGVARVVDVEGLRWTAGLGLGVGTHRLEPGGARALDASWAWRLGPVASTRLRAQLAGPIGVAVGATLGYSLATYGAFEGGERFARVGSLWGALAMSSTLSF